MSKLSLVIGNRNYSSWSLRPWLLLKQHGINFDEIYVPLYVAGYQEQLARYTPAGKVPALIDNGHLVWDSLAICEYVSDKFLGGRGWPSDPFERGEARSISAEMHSGFADLRSNFPMNCRRPPFRAAGYSSAVRQNIERIGQIWNGCRERYASRGSWLFGSFGIADAMYAPVAVRFHVYGLPVEGLARDYMFALLALPAMQEWFRAAREEREVLSQYELNT